MSTLVQFFSSQADLWIIAVFCLPEQVGYYAAASRLVILLTVPWMVMNAVVQPMVAELWARGQKGLLQVLLRKVANGMFVIGAVPALVFMTWGDLILSWLFGDVYAHGFDVLRILALCQLANLAACPAGILLAMSGLQKRLMQSTIAATIVFMGISILFAPEHGSTAVAIGVCVSAMVRQGLMAFACQKHLGIRTWIGGRLETHP